MFCSSCKKEIPGDSRFCQHCGRPTDSGSRNIQNQPKKPTVGEILLGEASGNITFDDARIYREHLAEQLARSDLPEAVHAAVNHVYEAVSIEMRKLAASAGMEKEFLEAEAVWEQYRRDFLDPTSPLSKVMRAKNTAEILQTVKQDEAETRRLFQKYAAYGADPKHLDTLLKSDADLKALEGQDVEINRRFEQSAADLLRAAKAKLSDYYVGIFRKK